MLSNKIWSFIRFDGKIGNDLVLVLVVIHGMGNQKIKYTKQNDWSTLSNLLSIVSYHSAGEQHQAEAEEEGSASAYLSNEKSIIHVVVIGSNIWSETSQRKHSKNTNITKWVLSI